MSESGARLLVVEDFTPLRVLITRVLTAEGHQVTAVATAPEARALSASEVFDVLVTDMQVPGGSGAEIAQEVALAHPGLRVLFVSGKAVGARDVDFPDARTDFLLKPFDVDELAERVRNLLDD